MAGVTGSVRLLNVTYSDSMANVSSGAFFDVADPLCREVSQSLSLMTVTDMTQSTSTLVFSHTLLYLLIG